MFKFSSSRNLKSLVLAATLVLGGFAHAIDEKQAPMVSTDKPREFDGIGIDEHLGQQVDLTMKFKDETGKDVTLANYYDGIHPVVISMVYFNCPGLCNFHLNGVVESMKEMDWKAGEKFQLLAISFDPKETPDLAAPKKANYMKLYDRAGTENGFHFLTADAETIKKITETVGFKYRWDEQSKEWAHASAAVITNPDGKISRYLHGIMFDAPTFKMALNEATQGRIGNVIDQMIFYCFKYDPTKSKYTLYAFRIVQIGGVLVILILAALLGPVWLRARKEDKAA